MDPSEKERYEQQVRENSVRLVIDQLGSSKIVFDRVIYRADKIAKYILKGEFPSAGK